MSKLVKNHLEALADHEIFYTLCMFNWIHLINYIYASFRLNMSTIWTIH
jgi:hypothetical protein